MQENKPKPHVHADVIKAWADGETIEVYDVDNWQVCHYPQWHPKHQYRVQPKKIHLKYRLALFKYDDDEYLVAVNKPETVRDWQQRPFFVRWVTDWMTTDV